MPAGVTAQIRLSIAAKLVGDNDLGSPVLKLNDITDTLELTAGTDAVTKADLLFSDQRTIAASGNEDIDLAGVLEDAFGGTVTAAELVAIYVKASADNTNDVQVSVPASNGFTGPFLAASDGYSIAPGEYFFAQSRAGWAVTADTGDLLNIANGGAGSGVDYDIVLIGRTVAA